MSAVTGPADETGDRAALQRNRILDAAQRCFIEHGFHAASMAEISAAAEMSPGLIYRYFTSKNAIILAIICRQLQEARADIASLQSGDDLIPRIVELFARWKNGDSRVMNPVLFLEMSAEASRDPQIRQALADAERIRRADFDKWLRQTARDQGCELGDDEARRRVVTLQCFIEGLAVRAVKEPDIDPDVLIGSLRLFLPRLMTFDGD